MKKLLLFTFISFLSCIPQLHSISVAEYIQQHGMPEFVEGNELVLSYRNITDLTGLQDIEDINEVIVISLEFNQIQTLPVDIFSGLDNLETLVLAANQLTTLPTGIFNGLDNLEYLDLSHNQLRELPVGIFNDLDNLEYLDLSYDQLRELPVGIFNGLDNLEYLDLSHNQLRELPVGIFSDLNNLKGLSLRGNSFDLDYIPTLIEMIRNIPNLEILDGKPKEQALKEPPYSTLFETAAENIVQNIDQYRPRLRELSIDILEKLPLPEQAKTQLIIEKVKQNIDEYTIAALNELPLLQPKKAQLIADKIAQNINQYLPILHQLRQDVLDLLPLTPEQRAEVTAKKRRLS